MKVLTVLGARPQFVKAAVVSRAFINFRPDLKEIIVHTGQHYDVNMSEVFFDELNIPRPDYNLGVGGGSHGQNTGRMIERLEELMINEKPDWVMVYGDTDSTLAGALAAVKLHIPIAHVEAGLRSFNRHMPEEINRVVTDHVSEILLAPTQTGINNLRHEGIDPAKINVVGDVMYDAALYYKEMFLKPRWFDEILSGTSAFVLCTIHRAENTDDAEKMRGILSGLEKGGVPVVLPLHPRTKLKLTEMEIAIPECVYAVEPVSYLEMVWLESNCKLIATDSGGVQKEAFFHKKVCITLRNETEWVELVECGANFLCGTDEVKIANTIKADLAFPAKVENFYGEGIAGVTIAKDFFK